VRARSRRRARAAAAFAAVAAFALFSRGALAADSTLAVNPSDLAELSLEELMSVELTSASRTEESLWRTPAAVYVITSEDLRRSGVQTIPDALRIVPGVQVASVNGNVWAVSARGFNSAFANKLLVMIDGRSIYSPLFSGVYWDEQGISLADIERIEVVRGPGGALWGANAVNGVINIVTKRPADTQGGLVEAIGGNEEQRALGARYGARPSSKIAYRVYGRASGRDDFASRSGDEISNGLSTLAGGFHLDLEESERDLLRFQAHAYENHPSQLYTLAVLEAPYSRSFDDEPSVYGGTVQADWRHTFARGSQMDVRLFADRAAREEIILPQRRDNVELDLQHHLRLFARHGVIWGVGAHVLRDHLSETPWVVLSDATERAVTVDGFVQDEVAVVRDRLSVTLGMKAEARGGGSTEWLPGARMLWTPAARHSAWASAAKAARRASWSNTDLRYRYEAFPSEIPNMPAVVTVVGSNSFDSERLVAYEVGYRVQPERRMTLDLAAFLNDYEDLETYDMGAPGIDPAAPQQITIPLMATNRGEARSVGFELSAQADLTSRWRVRAGYAYLDLEIDQHIARENERAGTSENGQSPRHQGHLRSYWSLTRTVEFDTALYLVDDLTYFGVPSYARLDARVGWSPIRELCLSVVGQNLLDDRHSEFGELGFDTVTEAKRAAFGSIAWRF